MRRIIISLALVGLVSAPAQARDWSEQAADRHAGAFVGAQFRVSFDGSRLEKPRASLGVAPTLSRISNSGVHTTIGDGLALSLNEESRPELTLAGVRADRALGLTRESGPALNTKQGVSTGGWIAIGVGTVLVVGAVGFALWADHVIDCEERDDGC